MRVTWLHVSDFHFKDGDCYQSDRCLGALVKGVPHFREKKSCRPDLIFATGDVASGATEREYCLAEKFFDDLLEAAGTDKQRLFLVTGNHDVDRDIGRDLKRTLDSKDDADHYFEPAREKLHINKKQALFIAWYDEYFAGIRKFPKHTTCSLRNVDVDGCKIAILQVNTALFCSGREEDPDHNKLWIGRRCLDAAIAELKTVDGALKIALLHHPLDWLHDDERSNIKASLQENVDCILRGHLHETEVEKIAGIAGETLHLAAGAANQASKYPRRALYATFDGTSVTIFPIRYEDSPTPVWTVDPSLFPLEADYQKQFFTRQPARNTRQPAAFVSILQPPDVPPEILKGLDSLLLLPESGVVPFHAFRVPMREAIIQWALSDDEPIMLRLQAGEGGCGKTRLLIEVCKLLDTRPGWRAGFFRGARDSIVSGLTELRDQARNCLIVVDFAETKSEIVVALTRAALDFRRKNAFDKVRIVLLARDGGDWWNNLGEHAKDDDVLAAYLREPSKKQGPYRMSETIEAPQRLAVFHEALTALATFKEIAAPHASDRDLSADAFAQPLYLHLAALAVLRGENVAGSTALLTTVLGHERQYWREVLGVDGQDEECRRQLEQCVALLTLIGGAPTAREARDALKRAPRLRGRQQAEVDRVFDRLRRLYPCEGGIGPVRPDVLGEQLVAEALSVDDELIDTVLGKDSPKQHARNALTVLTRLARRDPEERNWLGRALKDYLGRREQEAREVGEETGAPMDEMLAAALRAAPRPTRKYVVNALRAKLPKETMNLKLFAMEVGGQRVEFLKEKGIANARVASEIAKAYEFLGGELKRAGKLKEALLAFNEALSQSVRLGRSSVPADRVNFAKALANVGTAMALNGSYEDALAKAEAAEEILRELAERQPDAYRADLGGVSQ